MKKCIFGYDQRVLMQLNESSADAKIDVIDLALLNWLAGMTTRPKAEKFLEGNKVFVWASYNTLVNDLPFLDLGRRAIMTRMYKLADMGVVEHRCIREKGTFSYYALTEVYEGLQYKDEDNDEGVHQNVQGCTSECIGGVHQNVHQRPNNLIKPNSNLKKENISNDILKKESTTNSKNTPTDKKATTLADRKAQFESEVYAHTEYPKAMLESFIGYWAEDDGREMAWEKAKKKKGTWSVGGRLATWASKAGIAKTTEKKEKSAGQKNLENEIQQYLKMMGGK